MVSSKLKIKDSEKAFTLLEVLVSVGIFALVGGMLVGILAVTTKTQQNQSAGNEAGQQLDFVSQTIGRLVRASSNIEIPSGITTSTLKLRMRNPAKDPTIISLSSSTITLKEGNSSLSVITSNKVVVNTLNFQKFSQYPGHDTVSIDITLTYNSPNPNEQNPRTIHSGIARVSAATFDSDLVPGADNQYSVGFTPSTRWKDGNFAGNLTVNGNVGIGTISPNGALTVMPNSGNFPQQFNINGWSPNGNAEDVYLGVNVGGNSGSNYPVKIDTSHSGWYQQFRTSNNDIYGIWSVNYYNTITTGIVPSWQPIAAAPTSSTTGNIVLNGYIGLGVTTPYNRLSFGQNIGSAFALFENANGANMYGISADNSGTWHTNILANGGVGITVTGGATQNVGIGTTGPNSLLEIRGAGAGASFRVGNTNAAGTQYISADASGALATFNSVNTQNTVYGSYNFNSQNNAGTVTRMVIDGGGNVGIGTSTPAGRLDVNGTSYFGAGGTDTQFYLRGYNSATAQLTVNSGFSGGYNGIGIVSNPANSNSLPAWGLDLGGNQNVGTTLSDSFTINRKASGGSWTNFVTILGAGNVGIGTTSPYAKLDVAGYSGATWNTPANAPYLISTTYGAGNLYSPGLYWRMTDNNPTMSPAGLFVMLGSTGTTVYLYNSNNYVSGMTGGAYFGPGAAAWSFSSDERLKTNVKSLSNALTIINKLNPVSFSWKNATNKTTHFGLIAQEVQKVIPEIVQNNIPDPNGGNKTYSGIAYGELIPYLISAVKEQQSIIQSQNETINSLQVQLNKICINNPQLCK